MKIKRRLLLLLVVIATADLLLRAHYLFFLSKAGTDAMVVTDIGWWPDQDGMKILNFSASSSTSNIAGITDTGPAAVHYNIRGTVTGRELHRPYVVSVQITKRITSPHSGHSAVADVMIVPIVRTKRDEAYKGEEVVFDLSVDDSLSIMAWGLNRYEIRCADKSAVVEIIRTK